MQRPSQEHVGRVRRGYPHSLGKLRIRCAAGRLEFVKGVARQHLRERYGRESVQSSLPSPCYRAAGQDQRQTGVHTDDDAADHGVRLRVNEMRQGDVDAVPWAAIDNPSRAAETTVDVHGVHGAVSGRPSIVRVLGPLGKDRGWRRAMCRPMREATHCRCHRRW
jgi:hypothetical protein